MKTLLLTLLLAGPNALAESAHHASVPRQDAPRAVFVVAEGTQGWQSLLANKVLDELNALLGESCALEAAHYDAEPVARRGFVARGTVHELLAARPRTPLREAMEMGFSVLMNAPRQRTMVVIAHEQFYSSPVSMDRLVRLARHSGTRVHTIHLASNSGQVQGSHGLGEHLRKGVIWSVERIVVHERSYSARETSLQLKLLSNATGGTACVAEDESTGMACADAIAATME